VLTVLPATAFSLAGYTYLLNERVLSLEAQAAYLQSENLRLSMELEFAHPTREPLNRGLEKLRGKFYLRSQLESLQDDLAR